MSLSNNDIDKIFQKAASNSSAPVYSDSYWDEMESILNNAPKKKRGFFWIFSGTLACIALIVLGINYNATVPTENFAQNEVETSQKKIADQKLATTTETSSPKKKLTSPMDLQIIPQEKYIDNKKSHLDKKVNKPIIQKVIAEKIIQPTPIKKEKVALNLKSAKESKTPLIEKTVEPTIEKVIKNIPLPTEVTLSEPSVYYDEERNEITHNASTIDSEKNIKTTGEIEFAVAPTTKLTPLEIEELPNSKESIELLPRKKKTQNNFYAIAGIGSIQKLTKTESGVPISLNAGIGYQINKKSAFARIGLEANATLSPGIEVSERAVVYNFGVNNYSNNYSYTKLVDIEIPLELGLNFKKSSIGVGTKVSYLAGTEMKLTQTINEEEILNDRHFGQKIGLKKVNFSTYAVAETQITKKSTIGAKVGVVWNSRVNESVTSEDPTNNSIFGQVFIKYNF